MGLTSNVMYKLSPRLNSTQLSKRKWNVQNSREASWQNWNVSRWTVGVFTRHDSKKTVWVEFRDVKVVLKSSNIFAFSQSQWNVHKLWNCIHVQVLTKFSTWHRAKQIATMLWLSLTLRTLHGLHSIGWCVYILPTHGARIGGKAIVLELSSRLFVRS